MYLGSGDLIISQLSISTISNLFWKAFNSEGKIDCFGIWPKPSEFDGEYISKSEQSVITFPSVEEALKLSLN